MANMSYCRFENALRDLRDCVEHLEDDLSESETSARNALIALCAAIASEGELIVLAQIAQRILEGGNLSKNEAAARRELMRLAAKIAAEKKAAPASDGTAPRAG